MPQEELGGAHVHCRYAVTVVIPLCVTEDIGHNCKSLTRELHKQPAILPINLFFQSISYGAHNPLVVLLCSQKFSGVKIFKNFCLALKLLFLNFLVLHICDLPRENRPSSHLVMIVEIPVLKFLIGVTSFCS